MLSHCKGHIVGQQSRAGADIEDALAGGQVESHQNLPALLDNVRGQIDSLDSAAGFVVKVDCAQALQDIVRS
jgi:hypothetical protein